MDGRADISLERFWFAQLGSTVCFLCSELRIYMWVTHLTGGTSFSDSGSCL